MDGIIDASGLGSFLSGKDDHTSVTQDDCHRSFVAALLFRVDRLSVTVYQHVFLSIEGEAIRKTRIDVDCRRLSKKHMVREMAKLAIEFAITEKV